MNYRLAGALVRDYDRDFMLSVLAWLPGSGRAIGRRAQDPRSAAPDAGRGDGGARLPVLRDRLAGGVPGAGGAGLVSATGVKAGAKAPLVLAAIAVVLGGYILVFERNHDTTDEARAARQRLFPGLVRGGHHGDRDRPRRQGEGGADARAGPGRRLAPGWSSRMPPRASGRRPTAAPSPTCSTPSTRWRSTASRRRRRRPPGWSPRSRVWRSPARRGASRSTPEVSMPAGAASLCAAPGIHARWSSRGGCAISSTAAPVRSARGGSSARPAPSRSPRSRSRPAEAPGRRCASGQGSGSTSRGSSRRAPPWARRCAGSPRSRPATSRRRVGRRHARRRRRARRSSRRRRRRRRRLGCEIWDAGCGGDAGAPQRLAALSGAAGAASEWILPRRGRR